MLIVRLMNKGDLSETASVHEKSFPRQRLSLKWLECNLKAFPRFLCFVAEENESIVGYITWVQKSGFRPEAIIELEQIAVLSKYHGKGIGKRLIQSSLLLVKEELIKQNSKLKHIIVTTRADNYAQKLYQQTIGAEVEATITNLYSADEVFMVARDV